MIHLSLFRFTKLVYDGWKNKKKFIAGHPREKRKSNKKERIKKILIKILKEKKETKRND